MNHFKASFTLQGTVNPFIAVAGTPGTVTFGKAPADAHGGGVSIREVTCHNSSGTITLTVVDLGASGTAVAGTVCALALAQATKAPLAGAPAGYFLDGGNYLGVVFPAGTVLTPLSIDVIGLLGR